MIDFVQIIVAIVLLRCAIVLAGIVAAAGVGGVRRRVESANLAGVSAFALGNTRRHSAILPL